MLRGLVVLFVGVNVALFFWIQANPGWGESDREPQRVQRQVSPDSIQVLPDLPVGARSKSVPAPAVPEPDAEASAAAARIETPAAASTALAAASTATRGALTAAASAAPAARRASGGLPQRPASGR